MNTVQRAYVVIFLLFKMDKYVYTLCIPAKDCTCEKGQKVAYPDHLEEQQYCSAHKDLLQSHHAILI